MQAVLLADPTVREHFEEADLDRLLDPEGYLGTAEQLVDRALAAHQHWRRGIGVPGRRARRTRLGYELAGPEQAPVLVLANSMGTTMSMWDDQLPDLGRHLRVLRYDHRGHGASEIPPGPYTLEQLGRDLLSLFDDLELERVSFCGLSMGGMVGMWLAANAPDRIDRLAPCCTSAKVDPDPYLERAANVRANGTGSVVDDVVERWFTPAFRQAAPRTVAKAVAMLAATSDEGYAGCCEAIAAMDLRADSRRSRPRPWSSPAPTTRPAATPCRGDRAAIGGAGWRWSRAPPTWQHPEPNWSPPAPRPSRRPLRQLTRSHDMDDHTAATRA